jgi:tetratricopeptide (TPR) repeat protein
MIAASRPPPMKFPLQSLPTGISRRSVLKSLSFAPLFLRSAAISPFCLAQNSNHHAVEFPLTDPRLSPHYPSRSPLADILELTSPGSDEFPLEKFATEIESLLNRWGAALRNSIGQFIEIAPYLDQQLEASDIDSPSETPIRSGFGVEASRLIFGPPTTGSREQFLPRLAKWLKPATFVETAEFEIYSIQQIHASPLTLSLELRYDIVSTTPDRKREERVGSWHMEWSLDESQAWKAHKWHFAGETRCTVQSPAFVDVTAAAFGAINSYKSQLLYGADYWRTVLDGAVGVDVYGNNGIAAGDFDGDDHDDLYICQPAGLPNRLYRNRGDGTFEDVTEKAGVGVLDGTACALFADFLNRGRQDLLLVCGTGPVLFLNNGNGTFSRKHDAFKFARAPQGSFTHAAIADYDKDGRLDIYFCLYMYYLGLEQYNYPIPYFDARNGPPNCLFHNQGDGTFVESTEPAGLNVSNDRYSFSCAWGDSNSNGSPDLFVANDFGSSQLYRNNGDGAFEEVSEQAGIQSVGAGMGCAWADFNNDGHQDIYVPSMWEAAGQRVSNQPQFHADAPENIRKLYQRHARGNALYQNQGKGTFANVGHAASVEMGRWSWSSDFWDWDHDGFSDLYVSNGYLTGPKNDELAGFFWRQIVAKSPEDSTPLVRYEQGWNAINELVRADHTWHGLARNVAFVNNRDGTFTEASGALLLDFRDDARAFALADLDGDGRLEVVLKNRNAPQVRVLHNSLGTIGNSISFRLRGTKSNRDAIGCSVTIRVGEIQQTKYLQAGSGFLSQHAKELFFGIGSHQGTLRATVRWPSGLTQEFAGLPTNHRIYIEEGASTFRAKAFVPTQLKPTSSPEIASREQLPAECETWLIQPLKAPPFQLVDLDGTSRTLDSWHGTRLLLAFWATTAEQSLRQLDSLRTHAPALELCHLKVIAINLDEPARLIEARRTAAQYRSCATMLFANEEIAGIYNLLYRHLFDRRRDLPIPASFLVDLNGSITKVYQGFVDASRLASDISAIPADHDARLRRALPFPGLLVHGAFERNDFTYGVALYQHGFLDQAAESFRQVIASKPDDANAYYNLGTLNLHRSRPDEAKVYLQKTVELRPDFVEAWNNLGMLAAQQGNADEAIQNFRHSISLRPNYYTAHLNLGNVYRHQRLFDKAQDSLSRALSLRPDDPEIHYSLGMLFAQQNNLSRAAEYLERAISLRPDYPEALNNLGVVYVRNQNYSKAEEKFLAAIKVAPSYDQSYLNLARLYAMQNDRQKARETVQQLLLVEPNNANAKAAMQVLQ